VSLHYLVKYICKKLAIIDSKQRVSKQNTLVTKMQWMICTMLNIVSFVFRISGILNDMFVFGLCGLASLPFHPQWSRSLQYVYASVCWFHAFGQCCMFPKFPLITFSLFPRWSLTSKILPVFSTNCIFEPVQAPYQSLVFTAKWHITSPVYCQCVKNYYSRHYHLLLFTNIRNICNTMHKLIFV